MQTLEISAFEGQSSSYVVHTDGRVIVENASDSIRDIHNLIGILYDCSDMSKAEILFLSQENLLN